MKASNDAFSKHLNISILTINFKSLIFLLNVHFTVYLKAAMDSTEDPFKPFDESLSWLTVAKAWSLLEELEKASSSGSGAAHSNQETQEDERASSGSSSINIMDCDDKSNLGIMACLGIENLPSVEASPSVDASPYAEASPYAAVSPSIEASASVSGSPSGNKRQ